MAREDRLGRPRTVQSTISPALDQFSGQPSMDAHPEVESPMSISIRSSIQTVSPQPELEILVNFPSSFASLVDPNAGTDLRYIPTTVVNRINCARIEKLDVESEINYWHNAVLCSV